jgi:hypothetical protein
MKRIIFISIMLAFGIPTFAQHEWCAGGGIGYLITDAGHKNTGAGGYFGVGINQMINEHFSFRVGLKASLFSSHTRGEANYNETYDIAHLTNTPDDYRFLYTAEVQDFSERNRSVYLNIPIMLQYTANVLSTNWILAGGFKLGVPLYSRYNNTGSVVTTGYSEFEENQPPYQNHPQQGFSTYSGLESGTRSLKLKSGVWASAELGIRWDGLFSNWLYTGVFIDYALTNLSNEKGHFVEYNGIHEPTLNSINTQAKKIGATMIGITMHISLQHSNNKKTF